MDGIDALTSAGDENPSSLRSGSTPTLIPYRESVSAKLFEEPAFEKMTLNVRDNVDGGMDGQEPLC